MSRDPAIPIRRHARKVARTIDQYLAALDDARNETGASALFSETVRDWRRFATRVDKIDRAVRDPLARGADSTLVKASELHEAVYEIGMALENVGHAIKRARRGRL